MKYVVVRSTDGKNIGRVFEDLPDITDDIVLDFGYIFEVVDIRQLDEKTWEISNPNYILFLQKIQEE
jgi:hypothetical protein